MDEPRRPNPEFAMSNFVDRELAAIKSKGLYRELRAVDREQGPTIILEGREVLNLSSNNYLGLANHPELKRAGKEALDCHGCGSGASRLISGNMTPHLELEERIARFKRTAAALLFNTGFMANLGIITALVGPGDVVYSDALNHASIIDGCRLSRARISVYQHCDLDHLAAALKSTRPGPQKLIVTESVFSMDGDIAPLECLVELAERYGAMVMVDEAHATGVLGPNGAGVVAALGLGERVMVQMGTLGKALGVFGAYAAGSAKLMELLTNRARSFIYTTSLPPVVCAMARAAIDIVEAEEERRCALRRNSEQLRRGLAELEYVLGDSTTQILPVIVGDERKCMELAAFLLEQGFFAQGIRPPTVPPGTSRLRVTTMATHTGAELERAIDAFGRARKGFGGSGSGVRASGR